MKIQGLQKLTLLDYPGKLACTVFTPGCNFRCPFCHNASLVTHIDEDEGYDEEEIFRFLRGRRGVLDGVCITGGEPLMQPGTEEFAEKVKDMGFLVKLDTNGSFPDRLKKMTDLKLVDYVAMDLKNCDSLYEKTCGSRVDLDAIDESVRFLLKAGCPYEFRTTVVEGFHTEEGIEKIAKKIAGADRYFLQKFVDSGDLIGTAKDDAKDVLKPVDDDVMRRMLLAARKYVPRAELRGM